MRAASERALLVFALAALLPAGAEANDSEAEYRGGQLTFKKSDAIVLEEEVLTIGSGLVSVAYVFRNSTTADIVTEVAFPIRVEELYEGDEDLTTEWQPSRPWAQAIGFVLEVDGQRQPVTVLARSAGKTAVEVAAHWRQRFPAGAAVRVKHRYLPNGGFIAAPGPAWDGGMQAFARQHCIGDKLRAALKEETSMTRISYILKTGANWKGPIRRFQLVLKKTSPTQRVSLCLEGLRKTSPTTFELVKTDFTPATDLELVFIN